VTFTVFGPGTIVVSTSVELSFAHSNGVQDFSVVNVANTTSDCASGEPVYAIVPAAEPTDTYWVTVSQMQTYSIPTAGTYSFFVNCYGYDGQGIATSEPVSYGPTIILGEYYPAA
jgi:hypothetical protein